jgi:hypothetical protein
LPGEVHDVVGKAGGGPKKVHIVEAKVFAMLSNSGNKDPRHWVLDTGALNHMMGSQTTFASIDVVTTGIVRFWRWFCSSD